MENQKENYQFDTEASVDPTSGQIKLGIIREQAPNGVIVTLTDDAYDKIHELLYGNDISALRLIATYSNDISHRIDKIITSVKCVDSGKDIAIDENIARSTWGAIVNQISDVAPIEQYVSPEQANLLSLTGGISLEDDVRNS